MRYSYKTPSINLDIQGINIPKLSSGDDTTVNIAIGEGSFEVEGSATELIEFGVTTISEIKSFSIWLVDFLADIEARNTASSPDKDDEPADK